MRKVAWIALVLIIVAGGATLVDEGQTEAAKGPFIFNPFCPGAPQACTDVWAPVVCSNGVTYSNFCYARLACQTDCVPADIY